MTQIALEPLLTPHSVNVAFGCETPAVWVRAIRIVRALSEQPEDIVREVRLRRGLNIVWAPSRSMHVNDQQSGSSAKIAGHTAGKTSFVRLLRYVLGDKHFANESVRRRIRARFPDGWVLAEVLIGGETWLVARPLAVGAHPFCARESTMDNVELAPREPFQSYLDALADVVIPKLPSTQFPDGGTRVGWQHVLPWLARDQECRFSDPVEWRHAASDSESPSLSVDHRYFLVRAILNAVTEDERGAQEEHARLLAERSQLQARRPSLEHQGRTDTIRLQQILGAETSLADGLFGEPGSALVDQRRAIVAACRQELAQLDAAREQTVAQREIALRNLVNRTRDASEAKGLLTSSEGALQQLASKEAGERAEHQIAMLPAGALYCNVKLSEARDRHCPLAASRTVALDERRAAHSAAEERTLLTAVIDEQHGALRVCEEELRLAEADHRKAVGQFLRAQTAYDQARDALFTAEQDLREVERLLSHATTSLQDAERIGQEIQRLTDQIEASLKRQQAFREKHREMLAKLSAVFGHVVQYLLGADVQGSIAASGQALTLSIESNGDRDSAALSSVKVLAFDLMALTASIEGLGAFPRMLIHDGPREADLALDIYQRLFEYGKELESASPYEPAFQYIVTTTTEPPEHLQVEPWTRLVLSGAVGESRLYGIDL